MACADRVSGAHYGCAPEQFIANPNRTQTQTQTQTLVCVPRVRVTLATTPEWIPRNIIAMAMKDVG